MPPLNCHSGQRYRGIWLAIPHSYSLPWSKSGISSTQASGKEWEKRVVPHGRIRGYCPKKAGNGSMAGRQTHTYSWCFQVLAKVALTVLELGVQYCHVDFLKISSSPCHTLWVLGSHYVTSKFFQAFPPSSLGAQGVRNILGRQTLFKWRPTGWVVVTRQRGVRWKEGCFRQRKRHLRKPSGARGAVHIGRTHVVQQGSVHWVKRKWGPKLRAMLGRVSRGQVPWGPVNHFKEFRLWVRTVGSHWRFFNYRKAVVWLKLAEWIGRRADWRWASTCVGGAGSRGAAAVPWWVTVAAAVIQVYLLWVVHSHTYLACPLELPCSFPPAHPNP